MAIFDVPLDVLARRTSMKWTRYPADVLPMWVAEMDCLPAPGVKAAIDKAVAIGDFGYPGYDSLPKAWVRFARDTWGHELDQRQVMPCSDVVNGMAILVDALVPDGGTVAINTPIYPPFRVSGATRGRRVVEVPMTPGGRLDVAALDEVFGRENVSVFLMCNPHNPYGTVPTVEELAAVADVATKYGVRVVSDEIHGILVAEDATFVPYLSVPGTGNAYAVTAASKAFNLAALKAGLLIAGRDAVEEMWGFPYEVRAGASHLGLLLQAAGLDRDRDWLVELNREIVANKHLLATLLPSVGLSYTPSQATYLAWVDASSFGWDNVGPELVTRGKVAFNAGTDYSPEFGGWIRINLATSPEIIAEGVRRIGVARR